MMISFCARCRTTTKLPTKQRFPTFLPCNSNGSIIMTTRSRGVALRFVDERNLVEIYPVDTFEASALMKAKLGDQAELGNVTQNDILKLTEALEFMPLAIAQAATYIRHPASRCSVTQYLEDFQRSDSQKFKLLEYEPGDIHRDWDAKNFILVTWQLSFEHIRQTQPSAADLLSLMCLFDRQGIPESVLHKQAPREQVPQEKVKGKFREWWESKFHNSGTSSAIALESTKDVEGKVSADVTFDIQRDIMILRDYSFVSIGQDSTSFEMHRLVQLATQRWLQANDEIERWRTVFAEKLSDGFPWPDDEYWHQCQSLLPHAQSALLQRPRSKIALSNWALPLQKAAHFGYMQDECARAGEMAVESMKAKEESLGSSYKMDHNIALLVSAIYDAQGQWKKSAAMYQRIIKDKIKVLGKHHSSTLDTMDSLATTYSLMGRFQDSEVLHTKVLNIRKKKHSKDPLSVTRSMHGLALTYYSQERFQDAASLAVDILEIYRRQLGPEHHETIDAAKNLSHVLDKVGLLGVAESLGNEALETCKRALGPDHPQTLQIAENLLKIHCMAGRYQEANSLGCQVIESHRRVHGPDHPETVRCAENLSEVYQEAGRFQEAEALLRQVLESYKRIYEPGDPRVLRHTNLLAEVLAMTGRPQEARNLYHQIFEGYKKSLGPGSPETIRSMRWLAILYTELNEFQKSLSLHYQIFEATSNALGTEDPDTLRSMFDLSLNLKVESEILRP